MTLCLPVLSRLFCGKLPWPSQAAWHEWCRHVQVIVRYTDAILGGVTEVPTIHGQARLQIPAGTQSGQVLTMRGAGISPGAAGLAAMEGTLQIGAGDSQRGAHHFTVIVLLPRRQATCHLPAKFITDSCAAAAAVWLTPLQHAPIGLRWRPPASK